MSPTTPTIVHSTSSLPLAWLTLIRSRRPSGDPSANWRRTTSWLTIATGVESAVSESEKSRPAICRNAQRGEEVRRDGPDLAASGPGHPPAAADRRARNSCRCRQTERGMHDAPATD